eukprot:GHVS01074015.1.p1 GENE.GHVS01074015.1~~GHVS01074015.1.p1  ORF type:complete len:116 (-),score=15.28 GHVS01074015.1:422-769(-)
MDTERDMHNKKSHNLKRANSHRWLAPPLSTSNTNDDIGVVVPSAATNRQGVAIICATSQHLWLPPDTPKSLYTKNSKHTLCTATDALVAEKEVSLYPRVKDVFPPGGWRILTDVL